MSSAQTCGQGLANNSILPAKLGELIGLLAEILDVHMTLLDLSDPHSQEEREAYARIVGQCNDASAQLHAMASQMLGYRNLPMGRHDASASSDPRLAQALEALVRGKHELCDLLQETAQADQQILAAMRGG